MSANYQGSDHLYGGRVGAAKEEPSTPPPVAEQCDIVEVSPGQKANWTLTGRALDKLLARLDADRERAGEKYEMARRKLVKFFEWRGAGAPEECADETLNRVIRKLDEGEEIRDLNSYFGGVARILLLEAVKKREKEEAAHKQFSPPLVPAGDEAEDVRLSCFEKCLAALPADQRALIVAYYEEDKRAKIDARRDLAERLGIPLNALRIRAHRIRAQLEKCVRDCWQHPPPGVK